MIVIINIRSGAEIRNREREREVERERERETCIYRIRIYIYIYGERGRVAPAEGLHGMHCWRP